MLANILTKAVRDRWIGITIGAVSIAFLLLGGMAAYRDIDVSFYTELPIVREMAGIPEGADVGGIAYGAMYSLMAAITLAGLAISMGSASITGEERNGTIGLLLANPRSRTQVLLAKAGSIVLLAGAGSLILWGAGHLVPAVLDVNVAGMHIGALVLHIFANTLFYGFLAMMIGAWTGRGAAASGVSVAVMLVSYLAVGIFPLVEGLENVAKFFPWYYYNGSQPVINGADGGHLGVLLGVSAAFTVLAAIGVNRRDLKSQSAKTTMIDRLRTHPLTAKAVERIAGSARVSRISIKTAAEHQGLLTVTGLVTLYMGIMVGPIYGLLDESIIKEFAEQFPKALIAMLGSADMSTAEGFYQAEIFSLLGPAVLVVLTAVMGARALAGEEEQRTMGLLLANPIHRSRIVMEKVQAMIAYAVAFGFLTFLGTMGGSLIGGLGMSAGDVAATSALLTLLGLVLGASALLLSAASGSVKAATYGAAGLTIVSYLANSFLPLTDNLAGLAKWTPFYYYLSSDPLTNGMNWAHAGILTAIFVALVAISIPLFQRRDLRG
jgi:ABC-2 type transport system permease protein